MESQVQEPKRAHAKSISVTSTMSREIIDATKAPQGAKKFGSGKHASVELDPQPTDSPLDPLNWPQWKKELAFGSLLLGTAVVSIFKMMLVSVGGVLKFELNTTWEGVAALTGLPIMLGGLFGLKTVIVSQMIGKRIPYLVSSTGLLLSAFWTMHVTGNYMEFMASRVISGICWGSFEALVVMSIKDMYFAHERSTRITIYNVVSIVFTWGSPMLGGYVSQRTEGYKNQIMVVNIIQAFSILLLILATPETTFKRDSSNNSSPSFTPTTVITGSAPPTSGFKAYLCSLQPTNANATSKFRLPSALLYIRALCAPTSVLTFLLTAPLYATAIAVAHLLALLFSPTPILALPTQLGLMFVGPLVASLITFAVAALASYVRSRPPNHLSTNRQSHLGSAIPGALLGFAGIIAFGFYVDGTLRPITTGFGSAWSLDDNARYFNENIVSLLFGLLVSGAVLTNFATMNHIRSVTPCSNESDALEGAHNVLQSLLIGIFVIGLPLWVGGNGVFMFPRLKNTVLALGVVQVVVASTVAALLWVKGECVVKLDGRVLGRKTPVIEDGMSMMDGNWKKPGSFMEG